MSRDEQVALILYRYIRLWLQRMAHDVKVSRYDENGAHYFALLHNGRCMEVYR